MDPYRSLDASRLKLTGCAHWDPIPFLPPDLAFAHAEPRSLLVDRVPSPEEYPRADWESPSETFRLAIKWSENDLLHLEPQLDLPVHRFTKIFNARKSETTDRQIGDRRGPNSVEGKLEGPSKWLPQGESLTSLCLDAKKEALVLCVSDRRDFYHQLSAPPARAQSNRLFPAFPTAWFEGTRAYERLEARVTRKAPTREKTGDGLGKGTGLGSRRLSKLPDMVQPCFRSVLQGDHVGVEIATSRHEGLLKSAGLLTPATRICGSTPLCPGPRACYRRLLHDSRHPSCSGERSKKLLCHSGKGGYG